MAYKEFTDKLTGVTGNILTAAQWNNNMDGVQAEFEGRLEDTCLNGVISGFACTISGTSVAIASGVAYTEGLEFVGADTVSFTAAGAGTYYVYIDPTAPTAPYLKKLTVPTSGELVLCSVVWSGSALSGLIDRREWGIVAWKHIKTTVGSVTTGLKDWLVLDRDVWLQDVIVAVRVAPSASSIIVDVHAGAAGSAPTTVWATTQAYRPTITTATTTYTGISATGYIEVNRKLSAGDVIEIYVDQADNAATDLTVLLKGRWLV